MSFKINERNKNKYIYFQMGGFGTVFLSKEGELSKKPENVFTALDYVKKYQDSYGIIEQKLLTFLPEEERNQYVSTQIKKHKDLLQDLYKLAPVPSPKQNKSKGKQQAEEPDRLRRIIKKFLDNGIEIKIVKGKQFRTHIYVTGEKILFSATMDNLMISSRLKFKNRHDFIEKMKGLGAQVSSEKEGVIKLSKKELQFVIAIKLMELKSGDSGRLQQILETLQNGNPLNNSDEKFLNNKFEENRLKIAFRPRGMLEPFLEMYRKKFERLVEEQKTVQNKK